jgi:hypothetical protein
MAHLNGAISDVGALLRKAFKSVHDPQAQSQSQVAS